MQTVAYGEDVLEERWHALCKALSNKVLSMASVPLTGLRSWHTLFENALQRARPHFSKTSSLSATGFTALVRASMKGLVGRSCTIVPALAQSVPLPVELDE